MVFDSFRRSFDELLARATKPEERHLIASRMKDTLVQARVGLEDLRGAVEKSRQRLTREEQELETVRRRKKLAEGINDQETVDLAAKYESMHAERAEIVRRKVEAEEAELRVAEREVAEMTAELRAVVSGTVGAGPVADPALDTASGASEPDASLGAEIDALGRARARAEREDEAARRLEELKRRMGK